MFPTCFAKLPPLSPQQLASLIENIKDYQIIHGSLLKIINTAEESAILTRGIPVSLFPTPFPRKLFVDAKSLQKVFNELYVKLANDEEFLSRTLAPLIRDDAFIRCLWQIHLDAKRFGVIQDVSLGIFRSDYMIQLEERNGEEWWQLKQVEFNTFSVSGGVHTNVVADMHHFLHKAGAYGDYFGNSFEQPTSVPVNETTAGIASGLASAYEVYKLQKSDSALRAGILFIVQHSNYNICDERPLEYALWNHDPPIPTYRLAFRDILDHVSLGPSRELLFTSPSCPFSPLEISVVYLRAGYEPAEYDERGRAARLVLETSRAIKCPSILSHLTTLKKVQQELSLPGVLEDYLTAAQCTDVRATFAPLWPLDTSKLGLQARALATDPNTAANYILKPSLEGGGNNIYGSDISDFLDTVPQEEWGSFILMELIRSPSQEGMLMSSDGLYQGSTISELGIFGICLWKSGAVGRGAEFLENCEVGWGFKMKPEGVEEMSVVKGYGFFSSPNLVD
jgi:glutathione synthetase